ncbi:MAG TPA: 50S ribosomal protein L19 [Candidatus Saccharimonadales bacterium]|nr:50S ribosomal protein L19 [Candidatus Saccharimonadales bacterium]
MATLTIQELDKSYKKNAVVDVKSGDSVKVHQKIKEGNKERVQIFQGLVIRVDRRSSHTARILVRRVASGVGVEKSFLLHSPNVLKIEIVKRSKVRRNYLSYMRELTGKATRLSGLDFDKDAVNAVEDEKAEAEEEKIQELKAEEHEKSAKSEKTEEVVEPETK